MIIWGKHEWSIACIGNAMWQFFCPGHCQTCHHELVPFRLLNYKRLSSAQCHKIACFCLCFFFFFESSIPLVSSGSPSATGAPSVVVDSMQMLFGGHVGWCPGTTLLEFWRLGVWERCCCNSWAWDSISFRKLSGWRWVKWKNGEKEREGEERRKAESS